MPECSSCRSPAKARSAAFCPSVMPTDVKLSGSAHLDNDFGVTVDGEADYVCLGPNSAESFGRDVSRIFLFSSAGAQTPASRSISAILILILILILLLLFLLLLLVIFIVIFMSSTSSSFY